MLTLKLMRAAMSNQGTFGMLCFNGKPVCLTLEKPWRNNERKISCIPAGTYDCARYSSEKFPDVYEVKNVPGRSAILIHPANLVGELEGCIAPGMRIGSLNQRSAMLESQTAMKILRDMGGVGFKLIIVQPKELLE